MKEDVKGKVEAIELKIDELERQRKELLEELGEGSLSWGMMIMGAFGALLTGLGIIAIFAAKWDAFGRETRAFIACLPVVVFGMTAVWAYAKRMTTRFLWEPLGIFWCLSMAAAVCLIDRTYGVDGSMPGQLLLIAFLTLPVIWVTRSAVMTALWPVMAIAWTISSRIAGVEASVGFTRKSFALLALSLPAFIALHKSRSEKSAFVSVQVVMGFVYSLGLGTVLLVSLPSLFKEVTAVIYVFWLCAALVAGAGCVFSLPTWGGVGAIVAVGAIFPVPFLQLGATYVVALVVAAGIVMHGVRTLQLGFADLGAVALFWLVLVKFFASGAPFVLKGIVLITAGVLLTAFNVMFARYCKESRV